MKSVGPLGHTLFSSSGDPTNRSARLNQHDLATAFPRIAPRHFVTAGEPSALPRCSAFVELGSLVPPRRLANGAQLANASDVSDYVEDRLGWRRHGRRTCHMEL